jgi:septum formation protein
MRNLPIRPQRRLVLASQSPRRRELLGSLGIPFEVQIPDPAAEPDDVQPEGGESIPAFAQRLAIQKASSVVSMLPYPALVIGCDTVADVEGELLGKPKDRQDAARMLGLLSGRRHSVWSGLCLIDTATGQRSTGISESQLVMRPLEQAELNAYLDSLDWQGKSGAFGYRDGHPWLKLISGTADNVVGLPLDLLQDMMTRLQELDAKDTENLPG